MAILTAGNDAIFMRGDADWGFDSRGRRFGFSGRLRSRNRCDREYGHLVHVQFI